MACSSELLLSAPSRSRVPDGRSPPAGSHRCRAPILRLRTRSVTSARCIYLDSAAWNVGPRSAGGVGVVQVGAPLLLDPGVPPDAEGAHPGGGEQADDH